MKEFESCTDEELIQKLRVNEADVMEYLLDKYKPLVRKKANALYLIGGDTDDLIQEGMIGLFKAIRDYVPQRDASFYYFAQLCIERQMYTAVESSRRKKHAPLNTYVSLYETTEENGMTLAEVLTGASDANPEHMLIDRENFLQELNDLSGKLSKMEKQVLEYTLQGLDYKQIASKMEKSPKSVDNALQRIRQKHERKS